VQKPAGDRLDLCRIGAFGVQYIADAPPQSLTRRGAGFEQRAQGSPDCRLGRVACRTGEQTRLKRRTKVQDLVADRDTATR
jgi:hypothetical protein